GRGQHSAAAQSPMSPAIVVQESPFGAGAPRQLPLSSHTPTPRQETCGSHVVPAGRLSSLHAPVAGSHDRTLQGLGAARHVPAATPPRPQPPLAARAPLPPP